MARDERYKTSVIKAGDGNRYYWWIWGAHVNYFDVTEAETIMLPDRFVNVFKRKWSLDKLPLGMQQAETVKMKVNMDAIAGTALFGYLLDDGQNIGWAGAELYANTVWCLMTDAGDGALAQDSFVIASAYVQTFYEEPAISGEGTASNTIMDVELQNISKVALEFPVQYWAESCRDHISTISDHPQVGSAVNPVTGLPYVSATIRSICYHYVEHDSTHNFTWGVAHRRQGNSSGNEEQAIFTNHVPLFEVLQYWLTIMFGRIMRSGNDYVSFRSTFHPTPTSYGTIGTPYDYKTLYEQRYDMTGALGASLERANQRVMPFVRSTAAMTTPISGLCHQGEGLPSIYTSVLNMLSDMTEEGASRCYSLVSGTPGAAVLSFKWFPIWDSTESVDLSDMPVGGAYGKSWSLKKAGNSIGGCTATTHHGRGKDVTRYEHRLGGISANIRPYEVKCTLSTLPSIGDTAKENNYYICLPSFDPKLLGLEEGPHELGVQKDESVIYGQSGFDHWKWYYEQPTWQNGGPGFIRNPDTGIPTIVVICNNQVGIGHTGLSGTYYNALDGAIAAPAWDFTATNTNGQTLWNSSGKNYYDDFLFRIRGCIGARQNNSDLKTLSQIIGGAFSNRSQAVLTCQVPADSKWTRAHPASQFAFSPATFRGDIAPNNEPESVLLSLELEISRKVMWASAEIFTRAVGQ